VTEIEWATKTWNPTTGCDKISPGCDNCYALKMAPRLKAMGQAKYQNDGDPRTSGPGFALTVHPDTFTSPLSWKKTQRIFVNSMSDLFHRDVPVEAFDSILKTMVVARWHTFQVLTKRPKRMAFVLNAMSRGLPRIAVNAHCLKHGVSVIPGGDGDHFGDHIWWGTSVESERYKFRIDHLRSTPAAVRWLSLEPLLGPLGELDLTGIDWVVVGGESGHGARPMHPDWAREIRDQCIEQGVPFFFKQWGNWGPCHYSVEQAAMVTKDGEIGYSIPMGAHRRRFQWMTRHASKKTAGRELDGRTWDEYPVEQDEAAA